MKNKVSIIGIVLLILAAYEKDVLLGVIRVVGDGATVILVQDIMVFPAYHRQGAGNAVLKAELARYKDVRQIELVTDNTEKTIVLYQSVGFIELSKIGCCGFMNVDLQ